MRQTGLIVALALLAFACSETVGGVMQDAGDMLHDAGDMIQPDAGAQAIRRAVVVTLRS